MKAIDIKKEVSKNLKMARKNKRMSQEEVANMLNTKQTIYSRYETGKLELDYDKIIKICKILEITPNDIFDNCFMDK